MPVPDLVRDPFDLLPLRQMVRLSGDAVHEFARPDLLARLSRPDRYQIVRHGPGGQIRAAGECALAQARGMLRHAYGEAVEFGCLSVHSYVDADSGRVMVPLQFARVDAPRAHAQGLLQLLQERSIHPEDVELQRDRVVVRAEVPLNQLLGLEPLIAASTDGSAHVMSWLLRYAPQAA